jgi:hypothetical protein
MTEPFNYTKYDAIPTTYCQTEFRSRLEARWSVFFDSIEIPYRYEFKTFKGPTFRYTPDFWLNIDGKFLIVEVKPAAYEATVEDRIKWTWMHETLQENVATDSEFVVIYGMPSLGRKYGYWGKTLTNDFIWWRQTLPEDLAIRKYRNEYKVAATYAFDK